MGMLLDGEWVQDAFDTRLRKGAFVRADSQFRNWVTSDGAPGPTGEGGFNAVNPKNELMQRTRPPTDPEISARMYRLMGENPWEILFDRAFPKSVFASGSGVSNARSLALIFGALANAGRAGNDRLISPSVLREVRQEQWNHTDPVHGDPFRVALGFLLPLEWNGMGPGENNFGTAGGGGYVAYADPDRRLSFAYAPARFTSGAGVGDQPQTLTQDTSRTYS